MSYNLGTAEGRIVIDGSGAQRGFAVATVAANAFFSAIQSKLDSVERLGENLIKVGAAGGVGLGAAVKAAANFEAGLSAIEAVSGATEQQMDGIRKTALRLGKDTAFSATEAAFAMESLIKAGVSTEDVMTGAADATVNLAAAGGVDLVTAAEIAANALNQFNLQGKDMTQVADLIAGAANASAIDVTDFGFSLSQAGAVANLTGLEFKDLAVAIAEMGQAGIKGSDAGTSIKTFLTNLIPTMDKQKALFQELNLLTVDQGKAYQFLASKGIKPATKDVEGITAALEQYVENTGGAAVGTDANAKAAMKLADQMGFMKNAFFDANGELKSFAEVQEILQNATAGMTREQKLATLETLFGSDAIRAAAVFAEEGAEGYNKMAAAMGKISAAETAATRLDNLKGSIEQLKGSFETMMITIGEVFLPLVRKFVDGITAMINIFNNLPPGVQKAIAILLGLGSAVSLLTGLLIKLSFVLVPLIAKMLGLAALRQVFSIFTVGFKALRGGSGVMAALALASTRLGVVFGRFAKIGKFLFGVLVKFPKVLKALRFAWAFAFGPWGAAIAAVVAALIFAYNKFDGFRELVNRIASAVGSFVNGAWKQLQLGFKAFVAAFKDGDVTSDGFIGSMERLGVAVRQAWESLKTLVDVFKAEVLPVLQESGRQLLDELGKAWQDISKIFVEQVLPAAQDLAETFMRDVFPALQELWVVLQPLILALLKVAAAIQISVLIGFLKLATLLLTHVIPAIIKVQTFLLVGLVKALSVAGQAVAYFIAGLLKFIDVLINIVSAGLKFFIGYWTTVWNLAVTVVRTVFRAITGSANTFGKSLRSFWNATMTAIMNLTRSIWQRIQQYIIGPLTSAYNRARSVVSSILASIRSAWSGAVSSTNSAWRSLYQTVVGWINNVMAKVRGIRSAVVGALSGAGSWLYNAGRQIIQGLLNGINSMIGSVRSALGSLTGLIPDWKGPAQRDERLLTPAGQKIMQSLLAGFMREMPAIRRYLQGVTATIPTDMTVRHAVDRRVVGQQVPSWATRAIAAGNTIYNNWNVYNPVAEKTSTTTTRAATRRANLGMVA